VICYCRIALPRAAAAAPRLFFAFAVFRFRLPPEQNILHDVIISRRHFQDNMFPLTAATAFRRLPITDV